MCVRIDYYAVCTFYISTYALTRIYVSMHALKPIDKSVPACPGACTHACVCLCVCVRGCMSRVSVCLYARVCVSVARGWHPGPSPAERPERTCEPRRSAAIDGCLGVAHASVAGGAHWPRYRAQRDEGRGRRDGKGWDGTGGMGRVGRDGMGRGGTGWMGQVGRGGLGRDGMGRDWMGLDEIGWD